jgi:hypothetical protein
MPIFLGFLDWSHPHFEGVMADATFSGFVYPTFSSLRKYMVDIGIINLFSFIHLDRNVILHYRL